MNTIFHTGVSGMTAYQKKLDITAHNIANVNTTGYKPEEASFENLINTQMELSTGNAVRFGHGVRMAGIKADLQQGTLVPTGNPLDFAIAGDGFFAVENGDETQYTRDGAFHLSIEGNQTYLVSKDGKRVLNRNGNPIIVTANPDTGMADVDSLKSVIGVFQFENPHGLNRADNGRFVESGTSGTPVAGTYGAGSEEPIVHSGYLEASGVDLGDQMVDVIEAQRAFQVNARIVQTADEIEEIVNNLR